MAFALTVIIGKDIVETCLEVQPLDDFVFGRHHSSKSVLTLYARVHVHQPIGVVLSVLHISPALHGAFEWHVVGFATIKVFQRLVFLVIRLFRDPTATFVHIIVAIIVHVYVSRRKVSMVNGVINRSTTRSVGCFGTNVIGRHLNIQLFEQLIVLAESHRVTVVGIVTNHTIGMRVTY